MTDDYRQEGDEDSEFLDVQCIFCAKIFAIKDEDESHVKCPRCGETFELDA